MLRPDGSRDRIITHSLIELGSHMQGAGIVRLTQYFETEFDTNNLLAVSNSLIKQNPKNNQEFSSIASENNIDSLQLRSFLKLIGVLKDDGDFYIDCNALKSILRVNSRES